jgi:hypothetical protein
LWNAPELYVKTRVGTKSKTDAEVRAETKTDTKTESEAKAEARNKTGDGSTSAAEETGSQRRAVSQQGISATVKKDVLGRNQGCEFRDAKTGKVCGSKLFLEGDHIQPRFAGGGNEPFNLRLMCSSHNKFRYTAGDSKLCKSAAI